MYGCEGGLQSGVGWGRVREKARATEKKNCPRGGKPGRRARPNEKTKKGALAQGPGPRMTEKSGDTGTGGGAVRAPGDCGREGGDRLLRNRRRRCRAVVLEDQTLRIVIPIDANHIAEFHLRGG